MDNIDSKSCASRSIVREVSKLMSKGELSRSFILDNYHVRELAWKNADSQRLDIEGKTLKSLHTILQLGLYFRVNNKVAVFRRPPVERDGTEKVTSSFSILKSWSPTSLDKEDLAVDLAKKVRLSAGPALRWKKKGIASTDIFENRNQFAPHYLFVVYEIKLDDEERMGTKAHLNQRKNTEHFAGWFDPQKFDAHTFQEEYFDHYEGKNMTVSFEGAIDRLVLESLKRGDSKDLDDTTRGLARYFPAKNLIHDVDDCDLQIGEIDLDEHMEELLRVIQAIREENQDPDMEVTLQDVVMFEPNFYGVGIRGPGFLKWIKKLYDRAFN